MQDVVRLMQGSKLTRRHLLCGVLQNVLDLLHEQTRHLHATGIDSPWYWRRSPIPIHLKITRYWRYKGRRRRSNQRIRVSLRSPQLSIPTRSSKATPFYAHGPAIQFKHRLVFHRDTEEEAAGPAVTEEVFDALPTGIADDGDCPICLEPLGRCESDVVGMPCAHHFHTGCLRKWLHNDHRCPVCRYAVPRAQPRAEPATQQQPLEGEDRRHDEENAAESDDVGHRGAPRGRDMLDRLYTVVKHLRHVPVLSGPSSHHPDVLPRVTVTVTVTTQYRRRI